MSKTSVFFVALCLGTLGSCQDTVVSASERCGTPLEKAVNPFERRGLQTVANQVRLEAGGQLLWNGQPVADEILSDYLLRVSKMDPQPNTVLIVQDGTACNRAVRVRTAIKSSPACSIASNCLEDTNWDHPIGTIN